jgi:peptidyl-prolyl cis-trans isomerase D
MLSKFRKGADNIFVRILLILIALSFVGFGASSFLSGNSRGDVISFSKAKSIPFETFLAIKARQIEHIQRENNINLTEEQIKGLNIDHEILQKLINESMIEYLASIYDLDISDVMVINFVRKNPYFKDKDGNFDIKTFKAVFRNSQKQEDEYLENLKSNLIKSVALDIFMESFKPSKIMVSNVVDYMAETKYFDVISINLTNKKTDFLKDQIADSELEDFYKQNENNFALPELRGFDYISIGKEFFAKKINISEAEAVAYYDENKNDFEDKPYSAVKKDVQSILFNSKLEELLVDLAKKLEEDIATGISFKDLARKYGVAISSVQPVSKNDLNNNEKLNLADVSETMFEMVENEISYPIELIDQGRIVLLELKNVTPSRLPEFEEVKEQIYAILQERLIISANIRTLEDIKSNYDPAKMSAETLKANGISVESNTALTRADVQLDEKINPELAYLIFKTDKNQATPVVRDDKKAYFAFVRGEKINKDKAKKIGATSLEQINKGIKEGVIQELIGYLTEQNNMKVKL